MENDQRNPKSAEHVKCPMCLGRGKVWTDDVVERTEIKWAIRETHAYRQFDCPLCSESTGFLPAYEYAAFVLYFGDAVWTNLTELTRFKASLHTRARDPARGHST